MDNYGKQRDKCINKKCTPRTHSVEKKPVDSTSLSQRESTLFQRCVPAGMKAIKPLGILSALTYPKPERLNLLNFNLTR